MVNRANLLNFIFKFHKIFSSRHYNKTNVCCKECIYTKIQLFFKLYQKHVKIVSDSIGVNNMKKINWEFFQSLGKTFMLPVALLSALGIILGLGSALSSPQLMTMVPLLKQPLINGVFRFMATIGSFGFQNLPAMFAIAIPLGLSRYEKGVAAFAGFVGFYIMLLAANFMLAERGILAHDNLVAAGQGMILGVQSVDMGVLGGIISGIIVYKLHSRFYAVKLIDALSFFSGARFVPIITTFTMAIVGLLLPFIWPPISHAINKFGELLASSGVFAPFLFGTGERLLLPFGLHHILVALIRFTPAGGEMVVNHHLVSGALNIFYAQLADPSTKQFSESATQFLSQGKMPTFMFGLPGAALAMYRCANFDNRKLIKGVLISGVIACVVAGITEPLEFLFLFVAPPLYLIHAIFTGLGFLVMSLLHVTIGNTDGNIIDFLIFGVLQGTRTNWYLVPLVGVFWFFLYYFTFKFMIVKFNYATPGREDSGSDNGAGSIELTPDEKAPVILAALGGRENILSVDNCITRLRIILKNSAQVDQDTLKNQTRALGVMILDKQNVQVIYGVQVHLIKAAVDKIL